MLVQFSTWKRNFVEIIIIQKNQFVGIFNNITLFKSKQNVIISKIFVLWTSQIILLKNKKNALKISILISLVYQQTRCLMTSLHGRWIKLGLRKNVFFLCVSHYRLYFHLNQFNIILVLYKYSETGHYFFKNLSVWIVLGSLSRVELFCVLSCINT